MNKFDTGRYLRKRFFGDFHFFKSFLVHKKLKIDYGKIDWKSNCLAFKITSLKYSEFKEDYLFCFYLNEYSQKPFIFGNASEPHIYECGEETFVKKLVELNLEDDSKRLFTLLRKTIIEI